MKTVEPSQADIIISTSRLTKAFGNLVAVNDLQMQVMRGDVFGFLGPNGSGKTTTIRMLLGLIRPTAGRAIIFGMDNSYQLSSILQRTGAFVENPVFYPYLSGMDNLRVVAAASGMLSGKETERRLQEVLEIVGLRPQSKDVYRKYSMGMKQRLGIGATLLADPELVILDEPTSNLDPAGVYEIRQLILRLASLGKTIFLSSHVLHEVQHVCNRVAILQKGNLIKQGSVSDLLGQTEQIDIRLNSPEETQQALALLLQVKEQELPWITGVTLDETHQPLLLRVQAPPNRSSAINAYLAQNNLFAAEIHLHASSLEEIFLELTAPSAQAGAHPGMIALAGSPALSQPIDKDPDAP